MATKTNETEAEQTREDGGDGPLMDVTSAAVKKMLTKAKERGYVTYDELNQVLPQDQVSSEQIEDTMSMLSEMGISVIESEEQEDQGERAPAEADEEDSSRAGNIDDEDIGRTDDPVRMYLREMGSVELLSREGEIAIAKRIEAGREKMIGGICESPLTIKALLSWREALKEGQILLRDIIDLDATYGGTPDGAAASGAAPEGAMARGTADQRLSQGASATDPIAKRQGDSGSTGEQPAATNGAAEAEPATEGAQQTNGEDKSEQPAEASEGAGDAEQPEGEKQIISGIDEDEEDDEDEGNLSLAAMEEALLPQVLETFDQIAETYDKLAEVQNSRLNHLQAGEDVPAETEQRYETLKHELVELMKTVRFNNARLEQLVEQLYAGRTRRAAAALRREGGRRPQPVPRPVLRP
jgi:RNA polymerase primary sigma factor